MAVKLWFGKDGKLIHIGHAGCATPMVSVLTDNPKFLGVITSMPESTS